MEQNPDNTASILVIDDQNIMRKSIRRILEQNPLYQIEDFSSVREALGRLKGQTVDLVITDLYFPKDSGFDILRFIRNREVATDVPVIFVSGEATRDDIVLAIDLGASDYVIKPFESNEIIDKVRRALQQYQNPSPRSRLLREAERLYIDKQFDKSLLAFEKLKSMDPENPRFSCGYAQCLHRLGKSNEALDVLTNVVKTNERFFPGYSAIADIFLELDKKNQAVRFLLKELSISGKRAHRRALLSQVYLDLGDTQQALEQLRLALIDFPQDEKLLIQMAQTQNKIGEFDKSVHYYMKTRRQIPNSRRALDGLVEMCIEAQDPTKAIKIFNDMLVVKPSQPDVLLARSSVFDHLNEPEKALKDAEKALEIMPEMQEGYLSKARLLSKLDRRTEAAMAYEQLVKIAPEPENLFRAALSLTKSGDTKRALYYYDQLLGIEPQNPKYMYHSGHAFEVGGQLAEAEKRYIAALKLNPHYSTASDALKRVEKKLSQGAQKSKQIHNTPPNPKAPPTGKAS